MMNLYDRYTDDRQKTIAQGDDAFVPPHAMYEVVHSPASVTGHPYHVRQMGTQRIISRHHAPLDAVEAAISRAKNHTPHGRAYTRDDDAFAVAEENDLIVDTEEWD